MIGIIAAMAVEAEGLKAIMQNKKSDTISGSEYVAGKLCGKDAVIAVCGEGKVNAAMCAQTMILKYNAELIINTGVAGGLEDSLKVGDIVVADSVVQHDMDMSPIGYEVGYILGVNAINMPCDEKAAELLCRCVANSNIHYVRGVVASGDRFISSNDKKQWLKKQFNAYACEMEGGAIGQVCFRNNVPFCVLRAISDGGNDEANISFEKFAQMASENSIKIVTAFMELV